MVIINQIKKSECTRDQSIDHAKLHSSAELTDPQRR
jgi:hypothetical protein